MSLKSPLAAFAAGTSPVPGIHRITGMLAAMVIAAVPVSAEEQGQSSTTRASQQGAAASKAIQALKAKIAAISKQYPNPEQSKSKLKAVQAAIAEFVENNPEMAADAVQAAITEMGASKAEVGAIVKAAVEVAPGQAAAVANGALAVAPDAFAEIQASVPGVTFGPGNPLGGPGGGESGVGGNGGAGGNGGNGPVVTPPKSTETGFRRR